VIKRGLQECDTIQATSAGKLRLLKPNKYWIENSHKRVSPIWLLDAHILENFGSSRYTCVKYFITIAVGCLLIRKFIIYMLLSAQNCKLLI
jgi:hypothetical protein